MKNNTIKKIKKTIDKNYIKPYNTYMKIEWRSKALKQLQKLPVDDKKQITLAVRTLNKFPNVQNVKALKNHTYGYRLRVGRYRVLFDYENSVKIISIEEVRKRDDNTY